MEIKFMWDTSNVKGFIMAEKGFIGQDQPGETCVPFNVGTQGFVLLHVQASGDIFGPDMTRLRVECCVGSFTVRTADVSMDHPVYIPEYHVIVTDGRDARTFDQIAGSIHRMGLLTELATIEQDPEETYEHAARENLNLHGPAWLGLGRDIRLFSADMRPREDDHWAWVEPRYAGSELELPESGGHGVRYRYTMGRGIGCVHDFSRRLFKGSLPMLVETIRDKEVVYETTIFVSLERSPLTTESNRGTHFLVADHYGMGSMLTETQEKRMRDLLDGEREKSEETVAYMRTVVRNTGRVPRYAWYKAPGPYFYNRTTRIDETNTLFGEGFAAYSANRVFCVVKAEGNPFPQEEISILVPPGGEICIDAFIPHMPINRERARALMNQNFKARLDECVAYWEGKQAQSADLSVPERTIDEMIHAGLFHLDIATYGQEPGGTLSPTIGVYSSLASESWPIILYYDSLGLHDIAARCIQYFYDKQHDSGFMQNFNNYMLETGVALWFTAEHYYHTRDDSWLGSLMPGIRKAVTYLLAWRARNKRDDLRGKGYGMLEGRNSDAPDDDQRTNPLNALTYKGLDHISRICRPFDEIFWGPVCSDVADYRKDIRLSIADNLARGPVMPLGDGTWCPTSAPWAGGEGPVSLYNDGRKWYTHGMFVTRDCHLHQMAFCGILDKDELYEEFITRYHCEQFFIKNVRPSQPYYSRHPYLHLLRGEPKAFIRSYYNTLTSLADRETYSFWEHYFHASPHKTHEEGCFLMETRWMLYLEEGDALRLLMGVPGKWMEQAKRISVTDASSHFGYFSMTAVSRLAEGMITVDIDFADSDRLPRVILLRIPHPQWQSPSLVEGGRYCMRRKCIIIEPVESKIRVKAYFQ